MIHLLLHFLVPLWVAMISYRNRWKRASIYMVLTMLVDLDHLWADPIYDPNRCSIGFHPLHSGPFLIGYLLIFLGSVCIMHWKDKKWDDPHVLNIRTLQWISLGLLIHMVLDALDACF